MRSPATASESNAERLWGQPNATPYVKDAFHRYLIAGDRDAVNPAQTGTKAAAHYALDVPAGGSEVVRLRLAANPGGRPFGKAFDEVFRRRLAEADEFYERITPPSLNEDERRFHRQALVGMLWSKQYYYFDLDRWLEERDAHPLMGGGHRASRNAEWFHMFNGDILSMPDKWEYPRYAAWDLAFHAIPLSLVDFDFAKEQLLLLRTLYSHPNGQIPAYEWSFSDVNPLVHAWATLYLSHVEKNLGCEDLMELIALFRKRHPEVVAKVAPTTEGFIGFANRRLLSPLTQEKLERVLSYLLDEGEFLSPFGIRSLSRHHAEYPFVFHTGGQEYRVDYVPAESDTGMFGGNSNWRGPVWMPVNALIIRGLLNLYTFYGDDFRVECPTGSGNRLTLFAVAQEISRRLASVFLRDGTDHRPVYGGTAKFQEDPHWRDLILFYEYFHGDNGAGLGASHQTGWTGVIVRLLDLFGRVDAADALLMSKERLSKRLVREQVGGKA